MATLEYIKNRIESFEAQIKKSESTIERQKKLISKKESLKNSEIDSDKKYFLDCDIHYAQDSIRKHLKNIESLKIKLEKLHLEHDKLDVKRDNTVLIEFLNSWKNSVIEYYHNLYTELKTKADTLYKDYLKGYEEASLQAKEQGRTRYEVMELEDKFRKENVRRVYGAFSDVFKYCNDSKKNPIFNEEKFTKDLQNEYNAKYDMIIARVTDLVGVINEADLHIGLNGELNGIVTGTNGKCKVETIGAGGYNIQKYHFRVLVKTL